MSAATGLDHVGIVGTDVTMLAAVFERLGFCLTPLAHHAGGRTGNRCVMLRDGGYLELLSTINGGTSATLDRFLARYAGAHMAAFEIEDEAAAFARLRQVWPSVPDPYDTARAIDAADPGGEQARFTLITPPDPPEGRFHLIRHATREALWQARFLNHPNNALALTEFILTAPQPATTAAWFSTLAGRPITPDPLGGYVLDLRRGHVRFLPPNAAAALLGAGGAAARPGIAGITISTADAGAAIQALAAARGIPSQQIGSAQLIEAGGVVLRFLC